MVGAVQGLPATLNPGVQLETLSESRALLDALTLVRHPSGLHAASFVRHCSHRFHVLYRLLILLGLSGGTPFESSARGLRSKGSLILVASARKTLPFHARHEANAHQRAQVLRAQPQHLGARVEWVQEQRPPDCSSQCITTAVVVRNAIALPSTPSTRHRAHVSVVDLPAGAAAPQVLPDAAPRELSAGQYDSRAPARGLPGGRTLRKKT